VVQTSSTPVIHRRKSLTAESFTKTHGLPDPDGPLHKGSIFRQLLAPMRPGRMLDLGAGKGNFSLSAAELGWDVTAVDARTVRWPNADTEADPVVADRIRGIRWIQADVRTFPIAPGDYDLICILGLLHHLEVADQQDLLRRCASTLLLLDTRIAPAVRDEQDGFEGMAIREHGETDEERNLVPTAAWGNAVSFRHTEESLVRLLRESGYAQVMPMRPPHRRDYTFYLCLPNPRGTDTRRGRKGRKSAG
jgi:SAM-dependent methyltransferase